jgi:hypothetical protein
MKNLLRLMVVTLAFQSIQAIGVWRVDAERLKRELREMEDAFSAQEKALRERYAAIKLAGGVVKSKPGKQSIGCKTLGDFTEYMSFVMYGKGFLPSSDRCWPLEDGTRVKIRPAAVDSGLDHNGCTEKFDICLFDPGWFGKNFVTHIYLVEPIK